MDNLEIYNKAREVPKEAQKPIGGGKLKGKTDINPMWRIKKLTELFGPCGIGWAVEITRQWLEQGADGEVSAFVNINLRVKVDGQWSEPIPGTGGSAFVAKEKDRLNTSDECYKMAYTDAISVACKMLGVAADVYWNNDRTKYDANVQAQEHADSRRILPHDKFSSDELLGWLYGKMAEARAQNKRTSMTNILTTYYRVTPEDIQEISDNLGQYIIEHNLQNP